MSLRQSGSNEGFGGDANDLTASAVRCLHAMKFPARDEVSDMRPRHAGVSFIVNQLQNGIVLICNIPIVKRFYLKTICGYV